MFSINKSIEEITLYLYTENEVENVIKNSLCYIGIDKISNYIKTKFNEEESKELKQYQKIFFQK